MVEDSGWYGESKRHSDVQKKASRFKGKVIPFYGDAGHGWGKVKIKELDKYRIADKISGCSYAKGDNVYLEEDSDLSTYVDKLKENHVEYKFKEHVSDKSSKIRNYDSYNPTPLSGWELKVQTEDYVQYNKSKYADLYNTKTQQYEKGLLQMKAIVTPATNSEGKRITWSKYTWHWDFSYIFPDGGQAIVSRGDTTRSEAIDNIKKLMRKEVEGTLSTSIKYDTMSPSMIK